MSGLYWQHPKPADQWTKSDLSATLSRYKNLAFSTKGLRGHHQAEILERLERGLPFYTDDTNEALVSRLAEQLGRDAPSHKEACKKSELIGSLDDLATQRTFHQFMDPPPELRHRVYMFLFSYTDNAYHLAQAAVSRTSRIVRKESLPVFYETNRFGLRIFRGFLWERQVLADKWPTYVAAEHLALMRLFEITLIADKASVRIKVDFTSKKRWNYNSAAVPSIEVWSVTPEKYVTAANLERLQKAVEEHLLSVLSRLLRECAGGWGTQELQLMALSMPKASSLSNADGKTVFHLSCRLPCAGESRAHA